MDLNIMTKRFGRLGPEEEALTEAELSPILSGDFTQDYDPDPDPAQIKDNEIRQSYLSDEWRKEQKRLDKQLSEKGEGLSLAKVGDLAGDALAGLVNANRKKVYLSNRMKDLGRPLQALEQEAAAWKPLTPVIQAEMDQIRFQKKDNYEGFKRSSEFDAHDQMEKARRETDQEARALKDSASPVSRQAQLLFQAKLIAKAKEAQAAGDTESAAQIRNMAKEAVNMSAAQIKSGMADLKDLDWKDVLNNQAIDKRLTRQETIAQKDRENALEIAKIRGQSAPTVLMGADPLAHIPKEFRDDYLREQNKIQAFDEALEQVKPIIKDLANTKADAMIPLSPAQQAYKNKKANASVSLMNKAEGIRSDADFKNLVEPLLPQPLDNPEVAKENAERAIRMLESFRPPSTVGKIYPDPRGPGVFAPAAPPLPPGAAAPQGSGLNAPTPSDFAAEDARRAALKKGK